MKFKTIEEVKRAVESDIKVYWVNKSYRVLLETNNGVDYLRVTCTENWFGSKLQESELDSLFIEN